MFERPEWSYFLDLGTNEQDKHSLFIFNKRIVKTTKIKIRQFTFSRPFGPKEKSKITLKVQE